MYSTQIHLHLPLKVQSRWKLLNYSDASFNKKNDKLRSSVSGYVAILNNKKKSKWKYKIKIEWSCVLATQEFRNTP